MTTLVDVRDVTVRYQRAARPSLSSARLRVDAGEVVLVAGPSGCGKSTLLRVVNGLVPRSYRAEVSGGVHIAGQDAAGLSLRDISLTVGTLLQDPGKQVVGHTVLAELAFGLENRGVAPREILSRCLAVADQLGITDLLPRAPRELSGGQLQLAAFAGVLVLEPRVVVVDEPLANLDLDAAERLLAALRAYVDAGGAAVIVEHRVAEVVTLGPDRVVYLEGGAVVHEGDVDGFLDVADPAAVTLPFDVLARRAAAGTLPVPAAPPAPASPAATVGAAGPVTLRYRDVTVGYPERVVLDHVDLAVARGQRVAVLGPNGAGKSTLLRAAVASLLPSRGRVTWDGTEVGDLEPDALVRACGYVFQNPAQGLFCDDVANEVGFGPRHLGVDESEVASRVAAALAAVGLADEPEILTRPPRTLSFGQQRRLAVAIALALHPRTLVLDEPTAGQDLRATLGFLDAIDGLPGVEGQILVTHDVDLALSRSDRVVVVDRGGLAADTTPAALVADSDLWHAEDDPAGRGGPLRETTYVRAARAAIPPDVTGPLPPPILLALAGAALTREAITPEALTPEVRAAG